MRMIQAAFAILTLASSAGLTEPASAFPHQAVTHRVEAAISHC